MFEIVIWDAAHENNRNNSGKFYIDTDLVRVFNIANCFANMMDRDVFHSNVPSSGWCFNPRDIQVSMWTIAYAYEPNNKALIIQSLITRP